MLGTGEQDRLRGGIDFFDPVVHRGLAGLDARQSFGAQMGDAVGDPLRMLLDRHRHVAQHRRAAGSGHHEKIRKACDLQAQIVARPRGPGVGQRATVGTADIHAQQAAGHRIEAGGEHDHVQWILGGSGADAVRRDALDRFGLEVDKRNVVTIEGLEVIGIDRRALGRIGMIDVRQLGGGHRVLHYRANLVAQEIGRGVVGLDARQQVLEGGAKLQAAFVPGGFIQGLTFRGRRLQRQALGDGERVTVGR